MAKILLDDVRDDAVLSNFLRDNLGKGGGLDIFLEQIEKKMKEAVQSALKRGDTEFQKGAVFGLSWALKYPHDKNEEYKKNK